jgi:hypothetical protein
MSNMPKWIVDRYVKGEMLKSGRTEIVVDLTQRLGNQLFQFAAAKQLELDGMSVVFSDRTYRHHGWLAEGPERLERFTGAKLPFASRIQELSTGYLPPVNSTSQRVNIVLRAPIVFPTTRRVLRPTSFEPRPTTLPSWSCYRIQAYFQDHSWFERSLAAVLGQIERATHNTRIEYPVFDLCLNLRRGDYIDLGWDLPYDYYLRSLEVMADRAIESVVVTSDDRLAARAFCEILRSRGYDACTSSDVNVSGHRDDKDAIDSVLRDFCLMTNSLNLVMSNSTFCWWAAALGDVVSSRPGGRIVAYPRGWLEFPDDESDGLVRPEWTIVPT